MKNPQLGDARVHAAEDLIERDAGFDFREHRSSGVVVDGTAIVRVDEMESPEFAALVGVGDAGCDAVEEGLREAVDAAGSEDEADEFFDGRDEFRSLVEPIDEGVQGVFEFLILLGPGGVLLGFADGFFHVGVETIGLDGPGADEGLVEEIFGVAIWEAVGLQ